MREYVKQGQKLAKGNATGLIPRSRLQIMVRNQIIRMLPYMPWSPQGGQQFQPGNEVFGKNRFGVPIMRMF
jgi:hypothetical protein